MKKPEILFLKQEEVVEAGLLDMKMVLAEVEKTYSLFGKGVIKNPPKTKLAMPDPENWTSYFTAMPVYVGGDIHMAGFKWAAESVLNSKTPGMPMGVDLITLSDPDTVLPVAIMDGTVITAMRTSAVAGVAAKYLAHKDSKKATLIGAGVIGRTMVMAIAESVPSLEEIVLADLNFEKAKTVAAEFEGKYDLKVTPSGNTQEAVQDADLIVTETTARSPYLKMEWVKPDVAVIQMTSNEIEEDFFLKADKLYVDFWDQIIKDGNYMIGKLYRAGKVNPEEVTEIAKLVNQENPGREAGDGLIVCNTKGLGALDIMLATKVYQVAKEKGLGTTLQLWNSPLWV